MKVTPTVAHCVWLPAPQRRLALRFAWTWGRVSPWDGPAVKHVVPMFGADQTLG